MRATRRSISIERFWTLMTEHIDKLERLQQLLLTTKVDAAHAHAHVHAPEASRRGAEAVAAVLGAELRQAVVEIGGGAGDGGGSRQEGGGDGGDGGGGQGGGQEGPNSQEGCGARLSLQEAARLIAALPAEELKAEVLHMLAEAGGGGLYEGGAQSPKGGPSPPAFRRDASGHRSPHLSPSSSFHLGRISPSSSFYLGKISPSSSFCAITEECAAADTSLPFEAGGVVVPACERIALDSLKLLRRIGAGAMGTMYLAQWGERQVALKAAGGSEHYLDAWLCEVAALQNLHHPNVVKYLGAVIEPPTHALVLEYLDGRDLTAALALPTPAGFLMQVACGVAEGMAYLHSEGVMHRDLKGANVLLGSSGEVKLTDFGLCARAPDATRRGGGGGGGHLTAETGTYRWMAPEVIRHERYTYTPLHRPLTAYLHPLTGDTARAVQPLRRRLLLCDDPLRAAHAPGIPTAYYSIVATYYGPRTAYYLLPTSHYFTLQVPFADRDPLQAAAAAALQQLRPLRALELAPLPARLRALLCACWAERPEMRPSFREVTVALAELGARLTRHEHKWLDEPAGHPVYALAKGDEGRGHQSAARYDSDPGTAAAPYAPTAARARRAEAGVNDPRDSHPNSGCKMS